MLTCAEDDRGIVRDFSLIYLIGDAKNGYTLPERTKEERLKQGSLPNAAVCNNHLRGLRSRVLRKSYQDLDKEAYAVYEGIDENPSWGMGYVSPFGASPDTSHVKFLSGEDMRKYFPSAQKVILEDLLGSAVLTFEDVDQLFRHHNDGILRHFPDTSKEIYQLVTRAKQLQRADEILTRDVLRF